MEQRSHFIRKLPMPVEMKEQYPLTEAIKKIKEERDKEIRKIFTGVSDKFLLVIGPCSADLEESVLDYVDRLAKVQEEVKDKLIIVPRIYTNKPRTTGRGYKGLMHQPDPEGEEDVLEGIIAMRRIHTRAIEETGLTSADEMLYPENYKYLDDLLSYVSVGARSVENQQHRLTASGMPIPVGMKNPTSGGLSVMLNSVIAAQTPHKFVYRGWEVKSEGNPLAHAILRGSVNKRGQNIPNYHYEDLKFLHELYCQQNLENMAVIVDTNHNNSGKNHLEQIRIAKEVMNSRRYDNDIRNMVKGLMIESYIEDGAQKIGEGVYGKSITDPCLGWEKSRQLILDIAEQV